MLKKNIFKGQIKNFALGYIQKFSD